MKYIIIIIDGAADKKIVALENKTPLEAARKPAMNWAASHGKMGLVRMVPDGLSCGSDVAIMSLFGYNPKTYYTGRAPIEAEALGIELKPGEWVFRSNLVTIENKIMKDHSADNISSAKARQLMELLNSRSPFPEVHFYAGVSYRNLMVIDREVSVQTTPPHDILGKEISEYLPRGRDGKYLNELMQWSSGIITDDTHRATGIWLWGQGKKPTLPPFFERFHLKGVVITAVDLVRGLARLIGWDNIEVEGASGDFHTNYRGKGQAAIRALAEYDLVCVHIEAPDEAGHKGDALEKKAALEKIDAEIVGPLLDHLRKQKEKWCLLILPDHPTPCQLRTHTADPVPFVILASDQAKKTENNTFSEQNAAKEGLLIADGYNFIDYLIRNRLIS
jgi:2,3-bisphosphoglycerate-independent phosphoglycerate mutase